MLIRETLCTVIAALLLACIGLGPALWWTARRTDGWASALATAPTVGLALISLIGAGLVCGGLPVHQWGLPLTGGLLLGSGWLTVRVRKQCAAGPHVGRRELAALVLAGPACVLVLMLPAILKGIDYAAFRSNAADAFTYVSFADSYRRVPWADLQAGGNLLDLEAMRRLAEESPSSLLTARMLREPLALFSTVGLAWIAELFQGEAYRLSFAFNTLALALMAPLLVEIGRRLALPSLWAWGAALAIGVGFWSRFLLETDAAAHIASLPLLLLMVLSWAQLDEEGTGHADVAMAALAGAALFLFNLPVLAVFTLCGLLYAGSALLMRQMRLWDLRRIAVVGVLLALLLGAAGQWPLLVGGVVRGARTAAAQQAYTPTFSQLLWSDWAAGFWGLPFASLFKGMSALKLLPLQFGAQALALVVSVGVVRGAPRALGPQGRPLERLVVSMVAAALIWFLVLTVQGNHRAAGKACQYVSPLLMATAVWGLWVNPWRPRFLGAATAAAWLAGLAGLGMLVPFRPVSGVFAGRRDYPHRLDADPLLRVLAREPAGSVVTYVPPTDDWILSYFTHLAFGPRAHSLSGVVLDNSIAVQTFPLGQVRARPDYAVVARSEDFIAHGALGEMLVETPDLRLYRITAAGLAPFRQVEADFRARDARRLRKVPEGAR